MKLKSALGAFLLIILWAISVLSNADSPPPNTIPVIGLKPGYEDINTEFFCFLSWNCFDGLSRQGYEAQDILGNVVLQTAKEPPRTTCSGSSLPTEDSGTAFAQLWRKLPAQLRSWHRCNGGRQKKTVQP